LSGTDTLAPMIGTGAVDAAAGATDSAEAAAAIDLAEVTVVEEEVIIVPADEEIVTAVGIALAEEVLAAIDSRAPAVVATESLGEVSEVAAINILVKTAIDIQKMAEVVELDVTTAQEREVDPTITTGGSAVTLLSRTHAKARTNTLKRCSTEIDRSVF
jgi:hypothetical protein